jgi:hypothetical protein
VEHLWKLQKSHNTDLKTLEPCYHFFRKLIFWESTLDFYWSQVETECMARCDWVTTQQNCHHEQVLMDLTGPNWAQ